jgi:hypothetical protein
MKEGEGKMITDWLDKHGNPDIEKQVEKQLMDKIALEEASENYEKIHGGSYSIGVGKAFKFGAEWQSEKMYSEGEVLNFTQIILSQYAVGNTNIEQLDLLKETLHIFKKK